MAAATREYNNYTTATAMKKKDQQYSNQISINSQKFQKQQQNKFLEKK